ncbi:hypothetical protein EMCRGX_G020347 [Ephydatia muelleri]|eukprot:Em0016g268a
MLTFCPTMGSPTALDLSITFPLNPIALLEAGVSTGAAAQSTKGRKHFANDLTVPILGELDEFWNGQETNIFNVDVLQQHTKIPKAVVLLDALFHKEVLSPNLIVLLHSNNTWMQKKFRQLSSGGLAWSLDASSRLGMESGRIFSVQVCSLSKQHP